MKFCLTNIIKKWFYEIIKNSIYVFFLKRNMILCEKCDCETKIMQISLVIETKTNYSDASNNTEK